jgi:hypothetical protein
VEWFPNVEVKVTGYHYSWEYKVWIQLRRKLFSVSGLLQDEQA